jgi:hypothetical protein
MIALASVCLFLEGNVAKAGDSTNNPVDRRQAESAVPGQGGTAETDFAEHRSALGVERPRGWGQQGRGEKVRVAGAERAAASPAITENSGTKLVAGQVIHLKDEGKQYDTADQAAYAALKEINPLSIKNDIEIGSFVLKDPKTGKYFNSAALVGTEGGVYPYDAYKEICPSGAVPVALVHTHGAEHKGYRSDGFAEADLNEIKFQNRIFHEYHPEPMFSGDRFVGYLGIPNHNLESGGKLLKYDPVTHRISYLRPAEK